MPGLPVRLVAYPQLDGNRSVVLRNANLLPSRSNAKRRPGPAGPRGLPRAASAQPRRSAIGVPSRPRSRQSTPSTLACATARCHSHRRCRACAACGPTRTARGRRNGTRRRWDIGGVLAPRPRGSHRRSDSQWDRTRGCCINFEEWPAAACRALRGSAPLRSPPPQRLRICSRARGGPGAPCRDGDITVRRRERREGHSDMARC